MERFFQIPPLFQHTREVVLSGLVFLVLGHYKLIWIYMIAGGCVNAVLVKVLKQLIKQKRPSEAGKSGYGMPSSHSSSVCFFAMFLSLMAWESYDSMWSTCSCCCLLVFAILASAWRVQSNHHSFAQVAVGGMIGATNGSVLYSYIRRL